MKRTVIRSSKGKKLYAVRDKEGKFRDIQSYKRCHSQDMKRESLLERTQHALVIWTKASMRLAECIYSKKYLDELILERSPWDNLYRDARQVIRCQKEMGR